MVIADQVTKTWVRSFPEGTVIFDSSAMRIVHGENTGAIFGTFQGFAPALTVVTWIVIAALLILVFAFWRRSYLFNNAFAKTAVCLYIGGAMGNLIDRVRFGSVTDFLDFSIYPWAFNIADAAMTTAVIMFIYSLLFVAKPENKLTTNN